MSRIACLWFLPALLLASPAWSLAAGPAPGDAPDPAAEPAAAAEPAPAAVSPPAGAEPAPAAEAPAPAGGESIAEIIERLMHLETHGFVTQGYLKTTRNNFLAGSARDWGSLDYNQIGLAFSATVFQNARLGLQLNSRKLGPVGNNAIGIDWGFGDYPWRPWLGVRVGLIRQPVGLYNETRDVDQTRHYALLPEGAYYEAWRDTMASLIGLGLYGSAGSLSWQVLGGTQSVSKDGSTAHALVRNDLISDVTAVDVEWAAALALNWDTPLTGLRVGLSGYCDRLRLHGTKAKVWDYVADYDDPQYGMHPVPRLTDGVPVTLDLPFNASAFLSAEYVRGNATFQLEGHLEYLGFRFVELEKDAPTLSGGFWAAGLYRFTDWLELGLRLEQVYDFIDPDGQTYYKIDLPAFAAWQRNYALSARFDPTSFWTLKLEAQFVDGTYTLLRGDNPDGMRKYWGLFVAKTTFYF
jgi:hypothetical protein